MQLEEHVTLRGQDQRDPMRPMELMMPVRILPWVLLSLPHLMFIT